MKTRIEFAVVLLSVGALSLAGCGWDVDGVDRMNEMYPKSDDGQPQDVIEDSAEQDIDSPDASGHDTEDDVVATDTNPWPDVSYEGIEGRWAARLVSKADMDVTLAQTKMATSDLFIAEGSAAGLTLTFCDEIIDVESTDIFNTTTVTKEALRNAIAETPIELTVSGTSIQAQQVVWKWAIGEDIGDEAPLPGDVNTTNYPDLDGDSHEGVTISVTFSLYGAETIGERYMAKRAKFDLAEGSMSEDGRWISGTMSFAVEEKVLGADQGILKNGAAITPQTEGTVYQFRRVDDQFDCAALVAGHKDLFRDAP